MDASAFTPEQEQEIRALRATFPFRITYAAWKGTEFIASAVPTMRIPNKLAREGWRVMLVTQGGTR